MNAFSISWLYARRKGNRLIVGQTVWSRLSGAGTLFLMGLAVWLICTSGTSYFAVENWQQPLDALWHLFLGLLILAAVAGGVVWGLVQLFWPCRFVFDRGTGTLTFHCPKRPGVGVIPLAQIHDAQLASELASERVKDVNNPWLSRERRYSVYHVKLRLTNGTELPIKAPYSLADTAIPVWIRGEINRFLGVPAEGHSSVPPGWTARVADLLALQRTRAEDEHSDS